MRKTIAKNRKRTTRAVGKKKAVATKPRAKKSSGKPGRSGRLPSAIREHCRGSFAERVAILEAIADGKPLPTTKIIGDKMVKIQLSAAIKERVQAIDMLGKYGGVAELALTVDEQPGAGGGRQPGADWLPSDG